MFFISVVKQYERAVIFRLGRYVGTRGPGLVVLIPFVDRGLVVDQRELVLDEPAQSSITKDNALVDIDYVVYMQVVDAEAAVINVNNYIRAVRNMATTTLRSVIGDITVEEVLSQRETINQRLKDGGVSLHLSEVKGPVMDRLLRSHFLDELTGRVFLTQFDAIRALSPDLAERTLHQPRMETARARA